MVQEEKDRVVNTDRKIEEQSYKREPHERDESPDGQGVRPRGIMATSLSNGSRLSVGVRVVRVR